MRLCKGCMEHYDNDLHTCPYCGYVEDTPPESPIHLFPGVLLNERYIVGKVIGYGGFGVTYIAYDCVLQFKTAIKEYLPSEFATRMLGQTNVTIFGGNKHEQFIDGLNKFTDEAKKLAKFHSEEGIVKVFNTFEENNTAYIVMEYLDGETLADYLEREKTIPSDKAIEMMKPVIGSLKNVHKHGIIHRDIAPDNVFITKKGDVKLIDFGAARYATATHSRSLTVMIKPGYSPEEQYRSRGDQGSHTDVYAVAATMYKMITGHTPPDALERRAYFENKGKETLPPIRKYVRDIDTNIETAILNALNVRIEDRTPDMETFLNELTSTEPVKRRAGKIKKIDPLTWPLWAKISIPTAAVGLAVFIVLLATGHIVHKSDGDTDEIPEGQTRVPSVISREVTEGEAKLSESNLLMMIGEKVNNEEIPENYILTQDIDGGAVVPENTVINVSVSSVEKTVVPNILGMELEKAKATLEELGFVVTVEEQYDNVIAEGCIITQSAEPDSELADGSEIILTVSKGKDPNQKQEVKEVTLSDFVGMTYNDVIKKAEELGISVKVTERKYSKSYEKDVVMEQNPEAKSKIKTSQTVELVVSLGYNKVTVPDVTYMTEEKAKTQLTSRGLKFSVTYENSETIAEGLVISQNPKSDTEVDPESTVKLVVSKGASSFEMPNVVGMQQDNAASTLTGKGLSVTISYEQNDSKTEGEVLSQSVKSGTSVKRGDSVVLTVCTHSSVVTVPNVVGKTQSDAEKAIKDKGLTVNVVTVNSDTVEKGKVISQSPAGGSGLKKGDMVTINVSDGKKESNSNNNNTTNNNQATTTSSRNSNTNNSSNTTTSRTTVIVSNSSRTVSSRTTSSSTTSSKVTSSGTTSSKTTSSKVTSSRTTSSKNTTVLPTGISLSETNIEMTVGDTKQLNATVYPSNATDKSVTWSSNNTSVASVNNGLVTAVGKGTATITVNTSNGKTASCSVTVNPKKRETTNLVASGDCGNNGDNVQWELYDSGNLYIFGSGNMANWNYKGSPWYNNDIKTVKIEYGVTSIGQYAFHYCELTTVTIPDSVTSIGNKAFEECTSLTTVTIPDSVTSIGDAAFYDCTSLTTVTIPDSVTSIDVWAFYKCTSLTTVTIPDSVTSIGYCAFWDCTSLTTVTIPDSVTSIGGAAFLRCTSLTTVTIPDSVTSIGDDAFAACTSLNKIYFKGDKPKFDFDYETDWYPFENVTADVYYPANNSTWSNIESNWDGGGNMKFHSYNP